MLVFQVYFAAFTTVFNTCVIGGGVIRGYTAVNMAAENAGLVDPTSLTATNLRKYMATVTQVCDRSDNISA